MADILGRDKYKNASGWEVTDKIFGYLDDSVNLYNKFKSGEITRSEYEAQLELRKKQYGMFGLPQPWGGIVLFGGIIFLGLLIYKIAS